jgi:hypothetical protein
VTWGERRALYGRRWRCDDDAVRAFIADVNLERRDLKQGQRAIALAMLYPDPARGRGKTDPGKKGAESASFSYRRLAEARSVLRHSLALAEEVINDRTPLDKALAHLARLSPTPQVSFRLV